MTHKRPFPVTLLAWIVLFLAILNGVRFGAALNSWDVLTAYAPHPGPFYIALTGLFWCAAGLVTFALLWRLKPQAWTAAWLFCLLYPAYAWFDRLAMQSDPLRPNLPFSLGITLVFIIYTLLTLIGSKPHFLRGTHEQKIKN